MRSHDEHIEAVYPNHLRDYGPVFEVNTDKELEIMANKFRVLSNNVKSPTKQGAILGGSNSVGR